MTQYYILEIQKYQDGSYGHLVHIAYDADPDLARRKAESKYFEVLSAAAVSGLPLHAATLVFQNGSCVMSRCYNTEGSENT